LSFPNKKATRVAFPSFGDPILGEISRYWLSKRRDGRAPRRADIKPGELGPPIRNLNIIEVLRQPGGTLAFRHRLVGTGIIEWLSHDATGQMVDEALYGEAAAAEIVATLTRIALTALPYHRVARLDHNSRKFALMESVELPLSDDTHDVAMILRGVSYRHIAAGTEPDLFFRPLPFD
jgi:hypothetical protein